ncbi:MAG: hypothetical protein P8X89_01275 [Reinekea sp.]
MKITKQCYNILKITSLAGPLLLIGTAHSAYLEGYATLNGGTTGGEGGEIVYASTGTEINNAMCQRDSEDTPLVIYVNGTINHSNTKMALGSCDTTDSEIQFKRVSNISLIGTGNGALFDEIGIHLREASNIIIQNIHIRNVKKSGSPLSNEGDAIGIEKDVHNVWIDHNELEASGGEDDGYDALIDMKDGTKYVTVSYNYLHNSGRAGLIGSSDSDDQNNYITFHHNYYEKIDSRMPLLRHATVHTYNNYFYDISKSGMNSRLGGHLKAENNHFEKVNNPIGTFYDNDIDMGYWDVSGNIFENVIWNNESGIPAGPNPISNDSIDIPYQYALHKSDCVKSIVTSLAGTKSNLATAGDDCQTTGDTDPADASIDLQLTLRDGISVQLNWTVNNTDGTRLEVYRGTDPDLSGGVKLAMLDTNATSFFDFSAIAGTTYYYWVKVYLADNSEVNSDPIKIEIPGFDYGINNAETYLSAESVDDGINVSWKVENVDVETYQLYRGFENTEEGRVQIANLASDVNNYLDTDIEYGKPHYYWLKITDVNGDTMTTWPVSVTISIGNGDDSDDSNTGNGDDSDDSNTGNGDDSDDSNTGNGDDSDDSNTGNGDDSDDSNTGNGDDSDDSNTGNGDDSDDSNTGNDDNSGDSSTGNDSDNSNNQDNSEEETPEVAIGSFGQFGFILSILLLLPVIRRKAR